MLYDPSSYGKRYKANLLSRYLLSWCCTVHNKLPVLCRSEPDRIIENPLEGGEDYNEQSLSIDYFLDEHGRDIRKGKNNKGILLLLFWGVRRDKDVKPII